MMSQGVCYCLCKTTCPNNMGSTKSQTHPSDRPCGTLDRLLIAFFMCQERLCMHPTTVPCTTPPPYLTIMFFCKTQLAPILNPANDCVISRVVPTVDERALLRELLWSLKTPVVIGNHQGAYTTHQKPAWSSIINSDKNGFTRLLSSQVNPVSSAVFLKRGFVRLLKGTSKTNGVCAIPLVHGCVF